jgi:hypothetical protein
MDPDPAPDSDTQYCQLLLIDLNLNGVCGRCVPVVAGKVSAAPEAGGQVPLTNGSRSVFGSGSPTLPALID